MRSCLIQLLIAAVVAFALLWFGVPFGASWLATNALGAAGFTGTDTQVTVSSDLPPRLLLGHADRVTLTSTQVSVGDLHAATVDLDLGNVELISRTFGTVSGTLTGVRVPAPNGDPVNLDRVSIAGKGSSGTATLSMSTAEAESLAEAQLKAATNIPATVKFQAPDVAIVSLNGQSETGHLVVKQGSLDLVPDSSALPTVTLIGAGNGNPFTFDSVVVSASTVTLGGTIDLQSLLGL